MTATDSPTGKQRTKSLPATKGAAPDVEDPPRAHAQDADEQENLYHTRWWLVASAFPMIAGTLGPVASAFSICALVIKWRQHMPPGTEIKFAVPIPDPPWLTTVNTIQLAMALVSNIFLLLNMARRVKFTVAQPITIIGWYISSICLISLCATAAGPLNQGLTPDRDYVLSEAFYYGLWAAIIYFLVASLMLATFWGAFTRRFSKGFALTNSQRTLMLQTILFLSYLLLGALVFSKIEGWNYLDGVYWANITLFTVGFGDYYPTKTLARVLLFPYALIGIISFGLVISSIRSMILDRARRRVGFRMEEKTRRKLIRHLTETGDDAILKPITGEQQVGALSSHVTNEFHRRQIEFELMRDIRDRALARRQWMDLATSSGSLIALWLIGAVVFWRTEKDYQPGWNYFDSFYLCFVSLTTIGYGDRAPVSQAGKAFFVFWSLLALPTMTVLISHAEDTVVKFIKELTIKLGAVTILPRDKIIAQMEKNHLKQHKSHQSSSIHVWRSNRRRTGHAAHQNKWQSTHDSDNKTLKNSRNRAAYHTHLRRMATKIRRAAVVTGAATAAAYNDGGGHLLDDLPTGKGFQLLLIAEIQSVTQHLRENKPRRYTYEEWAWFLWLLGEDERNANTHHMARPDEKHSRHGGNTEQQPCSELSSSRLRREGKSAIPSFQQWSWVGNWNPLTADQEESEWVLDRLTFRLKQELEEDADSEEKAAAATVS